MSLWESSRSRLGAPAKPSTGREILTNLLTGAPRLLVVFALFIAAWFAILCVLAWVT